MIYSFSYALNKQRGVQMHTLLKQQLKKLSIKKNIAVLENNHFKKLLKHISKTYENYDATQRNLHTSVQHLKTVFEEAKEGILIEDKHRNIIHVNQAMGRLLDTTPEALLGKQSTFLLTMIDEETKVSIDTSIKKRGIWQGEVEIIPNEKKSTYCWLTIDIIIDKNKNIKNVLIMLTDISELYHAKSQMAYLASYDTLTNLPNRALLFDQLNQTISEMKRNQSKAMLIFIDVDHFKAYNDTYGHQIGDKVLLTIAQKIQSICRKEDILGRLSGDEFLFISKNIENQSAIQTIIHKLQILFEKPQRVAHLSLQMSISMGIAIYPDNGETPEALINAADQAMYSVKKNGRNNYAFYSHEMSHIANEYFFIQNALKDAIESENFTLLYQPQYALNNLRVTGLEVLLRCTHSRISTIPIVRLIKIAEESGLISKISYIVLNMIAEQLNNWELSGLTPPPLSVNLSRKELRTDKLIVTIHNALSRYKLQHKSIELEITESAFLNEDTTVLENISRLQKLGHTFSLDNYGTGFSSLANITTFRFTKLKIDTSFIENIQTSTEKQIIVSATISMAKKLGIKVIAQGVETQVQANILKSYGCDMVQGYLYSKPLSAKEVVKLL